MVELINRMRATPAAELPILLQQSDVQSAMTYFHVDLSLLQSQWNSLTPQAPLAYSDQLAAAALGHSQLMLQFDQQSHQLPGEPSPGDRITNAGYNWNTYGENVFAYAQSVSNAHAAFAIDWGNGPGGIQSPAGHRDSITNGNFTEVGIGLVASTPGKATGPLLVTQKFARPSPVGNPYILGVVYNDINANGMYDVGEGLPNVTITITGNGGSIPLTTSGAGYYQTRVPAGSYQVVATGGGLSGMVTRSVQVGSVNVKADMLASQSVSTPVLSLQGPVFVREDDGTAIVTVTRGGDVSSAVTVGFTVTPGTATTPQNYTLVTASPLTFAANQTERQIVFNIVDRPNNFTGNRSFAVALNNPTGGAVISGSSATVTIVDNDIDPTAVPTTVRDYYVVPTGLNASQGTSVLLNDTGATQAQLVTGPHALSVLQLSADGTFTYTPCPECKGLDSFTYIARNTNGSSQVETVYLLSHNAMQIRKLYQQVLNRDPERSGWLHWIDQLNAGAGLGAVASGIFESNERLTPIIQQLYQQYLGRDSDAGGLSYWQSLWQREGGPENVIAGIVASNEFFAAAGNTNTAWVTSLYQTLLGRSPDPGGLSYWVGQLNAGLPRQTIAFGFGVSGENRGNLVTEWFQRYLERLPTAAELALHLQRLTNGETQRAIQISLINSPEYRNSPPPPPAGVAVRVE